MKRIVIAAALMVLATAGVSNAQVTGTEATAARVDELRRALEAQQGTTELRAAARQAEVEDLTQRLQAAQGTTSLTDALATELRNNPDSRFTYPRVSLLSLDTAVRALSSEPVSYSISGRLPEGVSSSALPVDIVAAIRSDSHLKQMNVGSSPAADIDAALRNQAARVTEGSAAGDNRPIFNASFGFDTLEEFQAWYSAQGEALHRAIDRAGAEEVRFNLSVVPAEVTF